MKGVFEFLFFYFPFRVFHYYRNEPSAVFKSVGVIGLILMFYLTSLIVLFNKLTGNSVFMSKERLVNKYVYAPVLLIVITALVGLIYYLNKGAYIQYKNKFESYSKQQHRSLGIVTVVFSIFGFMSIFLILFIMDWLK